jgi:hypothetical protein
VDLAAQGRGRSLGIAFGCFFIVLGAWFLVREYVPGIDWDVPWPLIVIALGGLILWWSTHIGSQ